MMIVNFWKIVVLGAVFCVVSFTGEKCFSFELKKIPYETITGKLESPNGYAWNYGYDVGFEESRVLVVVSINLIHVGNVTKLELDRVKKKWKAGIENAWSNKIFIVDESGKQISVLFNVRFTGLQFHHEVIVRSGGRKTDELNWNTTDNPGVIAHEFGHMLGLFDEYRNGAVSSTYIKGGNKVEKSIMASGSDRGKPHKRHFQRLLKWFIKKTNLNNLQLSS